MWVYSVVKLFGKSWRKFNLIAERKRRWIGVVDALCNRHDPFTLLELNSAKHGLSRNKRQLKGFKIKSIYNIKNLSEYHSF